MHQKTTDRVVLFIIDQLRADYKEYMSKCSQLLPSYAVCDTNSFPASTEAMHANISTGLYPKNHGFVSKIAKENADGLDQLIEKLRRKELPSLVSLGVKYGFENYIIGGKQESVQAMGYEEDCSLMIYYSKDDDVFLSPITKEVLRPGINSLLGGEGYKNVPQDKWDQKVFEIFKAVSSCSEVIKPFFILTLSSLDKLGHDHGVHLQELYNHLKYLDNEISNIIEDIKCQILITGDHGCREVCKYLIEPGSKQDEIAVYIVEGNNITLQERYTLKTHKQIENMEFDGGIMRIWFKDGTLSNNDFRFLSKYGYIFPYHIEQGYADEEVIRLYENSKHENLGDIFVIARSDVSFCKQAWIHENIVDKITRRDVLRKGELPISEHGTYHSEDREVCFFSNESIKGPRINNVDIYAHIEKMMEALPS